MKVVIIGAPGSGKTWLAKKLEEELDLYHVEGDELFWVKGKEVLIEKFRLSVREALIKKNWVFEGHVAKVWDILEEHSPVLVVIRESTVRDFSRSLLKDLTGASGKNLARIIHHSKNWSAMRAKREGIVKQYQIDSTAKIFFWDGKSGSLSLLMEKLRTLKH